MTFVKSMISAVIAGAFALPLLAHTASAHIDLLSPKPLLDGRAKMFRALKNPPFGAPDVDVLAAPAIDAKAGGTIDLEVEVYVFHPGEIVVLYTTDPTGADVMPAMSIANADTPIPHNNLLYSAPVPEKGSDQHWKATVQLPDVEGTIYLVVRQVMRDKLDDMADGTVSLKRIYYHQATKLNLTR